MAQVIIYIILVKIVYLKLLRKFPKESKMENLTKCFQKINLTGNEKRIESCKQIGSTKKKNGHTYEKDAIEKWLSNTPSFQTKALSNIASSLVSDVLGIEEDDEEDD